MVEWLDDALDVRIVDDGALAARGGDEQGHGLAGLRERVVQHRGTLEAGPRPGAGYGVRAHLPGGTA